MTPSKITEGANDRPRDASIGQSAGGLPDDTGRPIEVEAEDVARIEAAITGDPEDESEAHPS